MMIEFLQGLFRNGSIVLARRPMLETGERRAVEKLLADEFALHSLDVPGDPIDWDANTAFAAAERLAAACWFLVHHGEPASEIEKVLAWTQEPITPAQHLSADLTLRFLAQVHRRARASAPDDVLTRCLERLLRQWPLSGVLAEAIEGPLGSLNFGNHPGLMLLYAERLADHYKPAWATPGPIRPYIELVFSERGLRVPPLPNESESIASEEDRE